MSTTAIDTSRTNERLSAFLTEIGASEPIDNYFPKVQGIKKFLDAKKTINGGRQILYPIDSGNNTTVKDFQDYDIFDTAAQDTALTVTYPFVNKGGTLVISWEEIRETAGNDHRIFDLVKHKRDNLMKSMLDALDTDLFAASAVSTKITNLPSAILSSGALGGLNASTDADWASTVTSSGSFSAQGLPDMRITWNTLVDNGADDPDVILTTPTIYQYYENEIDPDVRYAVAQTKMGGKSVGGRGFGGGLEFNGVPITRDKKCSSGVIYFIPTSNCFMMVDSDGNFSFDDFVTPSNQKASIAKMVFRGNLVINRRKSLGKMTSVVA